MFGLFGQDLRDSEWKGRVYRIKCNNKSIIKKVIKLNQNYI